MQTYEVYGLDCSKEQSTCNKCKIDRSKCKVTGKAISKEEFIESINKNIDHFHPDIKTLTIL